MPTTSALDGTAKPAALTGSVAANVATDWILVALPAVLGLRVFNTRGTIFILAAMALYVVIRKQRAAASLAVGPLLLFAASFSVVMSRPTPGAQGAIYGLITVGLVAVIAIAVTIQDDARVAISSLLDGLGLYLLLNLIGHLAGLKSPGAADRAGGVNESTGFTRVIFPFSNGLDEVATLAGVFVAAIPVLLVAERHWRGYRAVCLMTGLFVAWSGASRTALSIAVALPTISFLFPRLIKWMAPVAALFAATSALIMPPVMQFSGTVVDPIMKVLAPGRDTASGDIESLSNRSNIWSRSLEFWSNHVHTMYDQLFGFGQTGQVRSGVSLTYADILATASRHPRLGTVHNSFLQQLFDGGALGWLMLTLCVVWVAKRFSDRLPDWGAPGRAVVIAFAGLMFGSTVSVAISPGFLQHGFLTLVMLVAISCQIPKATPEASSAQRSPAADGHPGR